MLHYFLCSYIVTAAGLLGAYLLGEHAHNGSGLSCVFIVLVLAVLEVSLSFYNAVVNAMNIEKMNDFWSKIFLKFSIFI